jgi:spermidine synthase
VLLLFSALTFGAGLFNGADFPPAAACCRALTGRPEKAAGVVYGVELFGACAGALLASVVVAPVLGIAACCLLGAVGNGTAVAALLLFGRYHGD